jgi:hypothetical protein
VIVDGIAWMKLLKSLGSPIINDGRRQRYPPFKPPPLHISNQEERTTNSIIIGVEARVGEDRREETSEEEDEVNNTLQGKISVPRYPTPSIQSGQHSVRVRMVNQDMTMRLFFSMGWVRTMHTNIGLNVRLYVL